MTWTQLFAAREVQKHRTAKAELDNMRALIARDLADASIKTLSADRRFATAYNAALQAANMVIAASGYRVTSRTGHHRVAILALTLAIGPSAQPYADYFETCRRKRNVIDYTHADVATDTEAHEILQKAEEFIQVVEDWISKAHPALEK
jgi:uncharacterized protein (UPF0332 family)